MERYKVLLIDVETLEYEIKSFNIPKYSGVVDIGLKLHNYFESWKYDVYDPKNVFFIGTGPFAGSKLFGSHRMVAIFKSPESQGLHISEAGGVGYKFIKCGINGVAIIGKSKELLNIFIENKGSLKVYFEKISYEELEKIYNGSDNYKGVYNLTRWLVHKYNPFFIENNARTILVGKGALTTNFGSLVSIDVNPKKKELIIGSEDFFGRAGGGSVLAQAHNVISITAGGNQKIVLPSELTNILEFSKFYKEKTDKDFLKEVEKATKKYRYDEKIKTGGTFGCNYPSYKDLLPTFYYNSIYLKKEFRSKITNIILKDYWKPFTEETFEKNKIWQTCGEPCPVACKKVYKTKKVDYEPFQGVGPLIGIFNIDLVAEIVDLIDSNGLDAISAGHIVSFIIEAVSKNLLSLEETNLSVMPNFNPFILNPKGWEINGMLAKEILENLLDKKTKLYKNISEKGVRETIFEFEKKLNTDTKNYSQRSNLKDILLYQPYGKKGYMFPNFYWSLGFLVPIFVSGKYWTDYSFSFKEPEDFAKSVYNNAIKELTISNSGFCRFHRGWLNEIIYNLYELLNIDDLENRCKKIYRDISLYNIKCGAIPQILESEKSIDLFVSIANEQNVRNWMDKFSKDKFGTYKEWFQRFYMEYIKLLELNEFSNRLITD